ncbi:MAG TPA: hemerythrin domain-containing protein [Thermoleophilia bacterium]
MNDTPAEQLRQEHELVLMVVEAMEREVASIEKTGRVHADRVAQMVDFTRNFTDGYHHTKEEDVLFPLLEERSAKAGGTISVLLSEHQAARDCIRAIDDALPKAATSEAARDVVAENLRLYAYLLPLHIGKEDTILFGLVEELLSDQEQEILAADFMDIEGERAGADLRERYHELAHTLATPPADD